MTELEQLKRENERLIAKLSLARAGLERISSCEAFGVAGSTTTEDRMRMFCAESLLKALS